MMDDRNDPNRPLSYSQYDRSRLSDDRFSGWGRARAHRPYPPPTNKTTTQIPPPLPRRPPPPPPRPLSPHPPSRS